MNNSLVYYKTIIIISIFLNLYGCYLEHKADYILDSRITYQYGK
jgi:hypothetical protein